MGLLIWEDLSLFFGRKYLWYIQTSDLVIKFEEVLLLRILPAKRQK